MIQDSDQDKKPEPGYDYVPILRSPWDKVQQSDPFILSFCAMAIEQATRTEMPQLGKILFGDAERVKTVKIANLLAKTRQIIEAIDQGSETKDRPRIALNKHCPVCDFQSRCRAIAVEREDLSLLGTLTKKERTKCAEMGITTITQLSYRYRPRRRKRVKSTPSVPNPLKHDHRLKALAIKKSQIHVVGSPAFSLDGTPVFIDVEGAPDRDLSYLIGLRYWTQGKAVERSLWADGPEDEFGIWREFLLTLKEIDNPRLIHYCAYESRFLKLMRERWKPAGEDAAFVDQIIDRSTNLVSSIYGSIYFPTYTNGLKEIARWLGFDWTWPGLFHRPFPRRSIVQLGWGLP